MADTPVADTHPLPAGPGCSTTATGRSKAGTAGAGSSTSSPSFARHGRAPVPEDTLDLILSDLRHHCAKGIDDDVVLVLVEEAPPRVAGAVRG